MIQKLIQYLKENPVVVNNVLAGNASLVGVSQAEQRVIMSALTDKSEGNERNLYWA